MDNNKVVLEQRIQEAWLQSSTVGKTRYARWIEIAKDAYKEANNKPMNVITEHNLVKAFQNMEEDFSKLFGGERTRKAIMESTTTPDSINKFINQAFGMVTALIPNTILEKFTSVQTLDKRVGEVFYMDIVRGDKNKGAAQVASTNYMDSIYGPKTGAHYSDKIVQVEEAETGDGSTLVFGGYLVWKPVISGSCTVSFTIGATVYTSTDVAGVFPTSAHLDTTGCTVNLTTGQWALKFKAGHAPDNASKINFSYNYNSLVSGGMIPEVTAQLTSKYLTAGRRALNLKYIFDSALLLAKEHGVDLEAELLEKGTAGMMNEIAISAAADIYTAAPGGADEIIFDKTPPSDQIPYIIHRQEIIGLLAEGSLVIEQKIRYARANFVICGKDLTSVLRGLPNDVFQKAKYDVNPTGMHVVGMLDDQWEIIQNLDYAADTFTLGAMGPDFLHSGSIYAEFIPITVMNANWTSDADVWRTAIQWSAFTVLNSDFYLKGSITAT